MESKFRIKIDGKKVFGEGPCILLERVDKFGSLSKACEDLSMSYSKGWSIINNAEKLLNVKLLQTQIGGANGGGSHLTEDAKKLIRSYKDFTQEAEEILEEIFKKHF
ncbi:MAG: LysR family transcriptional regulator [Tissierellia bacterium]|nr:LysR family transcriptional regulator [Tissierellia bacterium]